MTASGANPVGATDERPLGPQLTLDAVRRYLRPLKFETVCWWKHAWHGWELTEEAQAEIECPVSWLTDGTLVADGVPTGSRSRRDCWACKDRGKDVQQYIEIVELAPEGAMRVGGDGTLPLSDASRRAVGST